MGGITSFSCWSFRCKTRRMCFDVCSDACDSRRDGGVSNPCRKEQPWRTRHTPTPQHWQAHRHTHNHATYGSAYLRCDASFISSLERGNEGREVHTMRALSSVLRRCAERRQGGGVGGQEHTHLAVCWSVSAEREGRREEGGGKGDGRVCCAEAHTHTHPIARTNEVKDTLRFSGKREGEGEIEEERKGNTARANKYMYIYITNKVEMKAPKSHEGETCRKICYPRRRRQVGWGAWGREGEL